MTSSLKLRIWTSPPLYCWIVTAENCHSWHSVWELQQGWVMDCCAAWTDTYPAGIFVIRACMWYSAAPFLGEPVLYNFAETVPHGIWKILEKMKNDPKKEKEMTLCWIWVKNSRRKDGKILKNWLKNKGEGGKEGRRITGDIGRMDIRVIMEAAQKENEGSIFAQNKVQAGTNLDLRI